MNLRLALYFMLAVAGYVLFPPTSFGASTPSARDIQLYAGENSSIEIPIQNISSESALVSVSVMSANFTNESDQPMLERLESDIASWVSISKDSLNLISGEESSVFLNVAVPVNTPDQIRAIAVVATEILPGQISLSHGSATLVFISIGNERAHGECKNFSTSNISITNSGRGILVVDGQIVLRGPFGIRFAQADINPLHHRILYGQTRSWSVDVPTSPWWSFGFLSYGLGETNIEHASCDPVPAGIRWGFVATIGCIMGFMSVIVFRARRS